MKANNIRKPSSWAVACMACLPLFSASAQATEAYLQSTIKVVYPLSEGSFVLKFNQGNSLCLATQNPQYFYVTVGQNGVTAEGSKNILATALAAYATASVVSIAFDTATTSCYINRLAMGE